MEVVVKPVADRKELKTFLHLPAEIHKNHKHWIPPIYMDEWSFFNPQKNHLFENCDTVLALAWKNGKVVGRIMGVISYEYNKNHNENHGRFSFMETWDDQEVFHALIEFIAEWSRSKGMVKLVGPLAFSDKDPQGFLIEGYEEIPAMATNCNFPYMVDLVEKEGFEKKYDLVTYKFTVNQKLPEFYLKISERSVKNNVDLKLLEFTSRKSVRPYIRPALRLLNRTFIDIYGFNPLTDKEMDDFANRYLYLINPRFIKMVVNQENDVIAFIVGMSDISEGIRKSKGHLFPFGLYHILMAGRKSKLLTLMLIAIDPNYQNKGLNVQMALKMIESAKAEGKSHIDTHLELEYNTKVRGEMEKLGAVIHKKFRIYQKDL